MEASASSSPKKSVELQQNPPQQDFDLTRSADYSSHGPAYRKCAQANYALGEKFNADYSFFYDPCNEGYCNVQTLDSANNTDTVFVSTTENQLQIYKHACEVDYGGVFRRFTGAIVCNPWPMQSIRISENTVKCFANGSDCQHYVDNPNDWFLAHENRNYGQTVCTIMFDGSDKLDNLNGPKSALPPGEPRFVPESELLEPYWYNNFDPDYSHHRGCREATVPKIPYGEKFYQPPAAALIKSAAHNYSDGASTTELLQLKPWLIQRQRYPYQERLRELQIFRQVCEASNGTFQLFSGVLDCVGYDKRYSNTGNYGQKSSLVVDGFARCFAPTQECKNYSLAEWLIDERMVDPQQVCMVRYENVTFLPTPTTYDNITACTDQQERPVVHRLFILDLALFFVIVVVTGVSYRYVSHVLLSSRETKKTQYQKLDIVAGDALHDENKNKCIEMM